MGVGSLMTVTMTGQKAMRGWTFNLKINNCFTFAENLFELLSALYTNKRQQMEDLVRRHIAERDSLLLNDWQLDQ